MVVTEVTGSAGVRDRNPEKPLLMLQPCPLMPQQLPPADKLPSNRNSTFFTWCLFNRFNHQSHLRATNSLSVVIESDLRFQQQSKSNSVCCWSALNLNVNPTNKSTLILFLSTSYISLSTACTTSPLISYIDRFWFQHLVCYTSI